MTKTEVKERLKNKIIAVIRSSNTQLGKVMSQTIIRNGIEIIEITFTMPGAPDVIDYLRKSYPELIIGAGTVTSLKEAKSALKAGAQFIVSPCVVEEVGNFCKDEGIFCALGAQTPTEVHMASLFGGEVVKLFPGELFNPSIIKILHGPFPNIEFMPTGGINDKNAFEWFREGAFALGVGGYLTSGINEDNLDLLGLRVKSLLNSVAKDRD